MTVNSGYAAVARCEIQIADRAGLKKQILGHEPVEVTRHYVQLASRHIEIQHKRFSPADNLDLCR